MFFSLQIDRNNINQAVSGTFLKDLKLNSNGKFSLFFAVLNSLAYFF